MCQNFYTGHKKKKIHTGIIRDYVNKQTTTQLTNYHENIICARCITNDRYIIMFFTRAEINKKKPIIRFIFFLLITCRANKRVSKIKTRIHSNRKEPKKSPLNMHTYMVLFNSTLAKIQMQTVFTRPGRGPVYRVND